MDGQTKNKLLQALKESWQHPGVYDDAIVKPAQLLKDGDPTVKELLLIRGLMQSSGLPACTVKILKEQTAAGNSDAQEIISNAI